MSTAIGGAWAPRVTRDVSLSEVRDLLEHPRRATIAFVDSGAVGVLPARARCTVETHQFAIPSDAAPDLDAREVVLVVDDGSCGWFGLRGFSVRGVAARLEAPASDASAGLAWYAIEPRRVLAWDYGAIREA